MYFTCRTSAVQFPENTAGNEWLSAIHYGRVKEKMT